MELSLHNHCYRCGHAKGSEEEYIIEAIKVGIKHYGISEHVPYPEGYRIRLPYWQLDDYLDTVRELKHKYREDINIYTGFECEYAPERMDLYQSYIDDDRVDYLILGHHYPSDENPAMYFANIVDDEHLESYIVGLEKAMESGLFTFIAHPDLFMSSIEIIEKKHIEVMHRICKAAKDKNMLLEFNANGLRKGKYEFKDGYRYMYPDLRFWEIVKSYDIDVIISSDAHHPDHVCDQYIEEAFQICRELDLNIIEDITYVMK